MGAYLAFGLNYQASASKRSLDQIGWTEDQLLQHMANELNFPVDNYEFVPSGDEITLQLRTDVLEHQLIPLLESVYPLFYPRSDNSQAWWHKLTQHLASIPPDSWISWAKTSEYERFCVEGFWDEWVRVGNQSSDTVRVYFNNIRLMMEGKIRIEKCEQSFRFIQHCITHAFPENPLARSLRIYIIG